jgi:RHS repeat-associated protein
MATAPSTRTRTLSNSASNAAARRAFLRHPSVSADPLGLIKQYQYDDANRRTQENHYLNATDASNQTNAVKSITYSYNDLDRLRGYDDGSSSATYTYDTKQLRRTGESVNYGGFSLSATTTWNSLGLKSGINYPDGASYTYTYDANNQIATVNLPTGFGSLTWNSYKWLAPSQITLPGGTVRKQDYDNLLRLKTIDVTDPTQNPVMNYQYGYDQVDNITSKTTELGTTGYGYDELDRLIAATPPTPQTNEVYTYDAVTNRVTDAKVSGPLVYNANNQLISAGSITYDYDANGNTIKQTDANNAANTRNYVYDTNDRLIEVRNNSNTLIAVYSYDPFGRRLSKDAGTSKTYFFYTDEGLIAEADATGTVNKTYGYAPGSAYMTNPLFMKYGVSYYYYQNDHLGTPQKLISQSGQVVWSATYDAFGYATVDTAYTLVNNLRFPGQYYDQETGLHNNWMRYYDPKIGRYVTSDPIALKGGINTYGYAKGNPISIIDPLGLNPGTLVGGEIGTIILPGPGTIIGAVIGTAIGVGIGWWIMESRSQGSGDEARPEDINPGKDCNGDCNPCPPNPPPFDHPGDAHGTDRGSHTHQWQYHQAPDCTCRARKESW